MWIFANFCRSDFPRETIGCPHVFVSFTPGEAQKFSEPAALQWLRGQTEVSRKTWLVAQDLGEWEAKMLNLALILSKAWYPGVQKAAVSLADVYSLVIYPHVVGISSRKIPHPFLHICGMRHFLFKEVGQF